MTKAARELAVRGAVQPWQPNAGVPLGPNHVNHVLAQFVADATKGTLPQVSWIVAPYEYSEHPAASPSYGAHYVRTVLEALMGNHDRWNSTALFVTYDLDRGAGCQHHRLAAVGRRRPDGRLRLHPSRLLHPGPAGHGPADHPVRRGGEVPARDDAARGRADVSGPGTRVPAPPAAVTLSVRGKTGVSFAVYPDALLPPAPTAFTVVRGNDQTYTWNTVPTAGKYAFSVYGPDGFLTSFAGAVVPAGQNAGKVPTVAASLVTRLAAVLRLTLGNDGKTTVTFTLTPNDFAGHQQTVPVTAGRSKTVDWPADANGYYDVTVTADSGDGFTRRYASRIA
jgi:hypothetical protein